MDISDSLNIKNVYECNPCNFNTYNKKDYLRHIITNKHEKNINPDTILKKEYICKCGKTYKYSSTLSRHKKICPNNDYNIIENKKNNEIIELLITQNNQLQELLIKQSQEYQEYQKQLIELIPKFGNNNNNTINSNNKVDINIFLNEKCKNAMSMDEFIKKIDVSLSNLLLTKDKGLAEGISQIFLENIKKLSLHERPLHCTDVKRETLYIKNDTWEKDENKTLIKDAIKQVSVKQSKNINIFTNQKPNFMSNQKDKDDFINIVKSATDSIDDKQDKVIRNLCKNVYLSETDYKD
jgi:hypothetical protein